MKTGSGKRLWIAFRDFEAVNGEKGKLPLNKECERDLLVSDFRNAFHSVILIENCWFLFGYRHGQIYGHSNAALLADVDASA